MRDSLDGVTEVRAGVYMFGDLFQAEIGTHDLDDIALTVLTSVIGRRPGRLLVDAGGLALSKDRSTADAPKDYGFGLVLDLAGKRSHGDAIVRRAYQEHGVVEADPAHPLDLPVGAKLRIAPNHTCMTAAAHDRYFVVEGERRSRGNLAAGERLVRPARNRLRSAVLIYIDCRFLERVVSSRTPIPTNGAPIRAPPRRSRQGSRWSGSSGFACWSAPPTARSSRGASSGWYLSLNRPPGTPPELGVRRRSGPGSTS